MRRMSLCKRTPTDHPSMDPFFFMIKNGRLFIPGLI